jgi:DNA polymerase-1
LQVHDVFIFEIAGAALEKTQALIVKAMKSIGSLSVPLVVEADVGDTWAEV